MLMIRHAPFCLLTVMVARGTPASSTGHGQGGRKAAQKQSLMYWASSFATSALMVCASALDWHITARAAGMEQEYTGLLAKKSSRLSRIAQHQFSRSFWLSPAGGSETSP